MGKLIRKDETIENAFGVLVDCCEIYIKDGIRPPNEAIQALLSVALVHGGVPRHDINEMTAFLVSLPEQAKEIPEITAGEDCWLISLLQGFELGEEK